MRPEGYARNMRRPVSNGGITMILMLCRSNKDIQEYQTDPSRTPRISSTVARSVRNGQRSVSSVSWGSLNHVETGTALLGWKIYDAGELSMIMDDSMVRPNWERSCSRVDQLGPN
jgi:hypothetical protein